ncbi:MAG TPA: Tim44-like domain-containing protein, partial [Tepidisphaeraceae bacterium]|nr:Tim44-like domain-containing protein [Tepidisphaeraceae bacterium]
MRETHGGGDGRWRTVLSWTIGALAVGVLHDVLLARAGGGGNYSGGGGGGGGGGKGDDLFFLIWLCWKLIQLCYYFPYIGIPLVILIGVGIMMAGKGTKGAYQSRVIRRGTAAEERGAEGAVAARVREADPAFDPGAFVARARDAFMKIQRAWGAQDLTGVRPFISDAVYERFTLQFAEQKALGFRNVLDKAEVREASLAHGEAGRAFDEVSVRFVAYGVDRKVSLKDASDMGNDGGREFAEVWTFLRKRGAQTKAGKPGLIEGNCPNCGGAVEMNQSAKCGYCGAALRSGE